MGQSQDCDDVTVGSNTILRGIREKGKNYKINNEGRFELKLKICLSPSRDREIK